MRHYALAVVGDERDDRRRLSANEIDEVGLCRVSNAAILTWRTAPMSAGSSVRMRIDQAV